MVRWLDWGQKRTVWWVEAGTWGKGPEIRGSWGDWGRSQFGDGKCRVLFRACDLCLEGPSSLWWILHVSMGLPLPPGAVNPAACLHLGQSWFGLLTPLTGMAGVDLRGPRWPAFPSVTVGELSSVLHPLQVETFYFILEHLIPSWPSVQQNTINHVLFSNLWFWEQLFFLAGFRNTCFLSKKQAMVCSVILKASGA